MAIVIGFAVLFMLFMGLVFPPLWLSLLLLVPLFIITVRVAASPVDWDASIEEGA